MVTQKTFSMKAANKSLIILSLFFCNIMAFAVQNELSNSINIGTDKSMLAVANYCNFGEIELENIATKPLDFSNAFQATAVVVSPQLLLPFSATMLTLPLTVAYQFYNYTSVNTLYTHSPSLLTYTQCVSTSSLNSNYFISFKQITNTGNIQPLYLALNIKPNERLVALISDS